MQKKYQIFISSTYEDLKVERQKVQDAILSMYHFPIGMEMFSAGDEEQWQTIQETIDSSDYYILLIGHRYGTTIEEGEYAGLSYTQKEYRYAVSKNIPVIAFFIDDKVPVTLDKTEQNASKKKKLEAFKKEVKDKRMVEWWSNPDDLAAKVMNALNKQINKDLKNREHGRMGWIRGSANDFLYSLDKNSEQDLSKIIVNAKKVTIIGRTAINIWNQYRIALENSLKSGCEYRILTYDYKEKEHPMYSKNSYNNHLTARDAFLELQKKYSGLKYAETGRWPCYGILAVEYGQEKDNYIQILLYPVSMKGSERPMFKIHSDNEWYSKFLKEIDTLWLESEG